MNELEKLLQEVLTKYPELNDYTISIKYSPMPDEHAKYSLGQNKTAEIEVDNALEKNYLLEKGAIAHELSHILKAKKLSRFGSWLVELEGILYDKSKRYNERDEIQTDAITISRGFGIHLLLLEFSKMVERTENNTKVYQKLQQKLHQTPQKVKRWLINSRYL